MSFILAHITGLRSCGCFALQQIPVNNISGNGGKVTYNLPTQDPILEGALRTWYDDGGVGGDFSQQNVLPNFSLQSYAFD